MQHDFEPLLKFLERLPAIDLPAGRKSFGFGDFENGNWWVKFTLDTNHDLAWRHVQELGHVLNYLSLDERLPSVFMPVSPPPYMNGGVEFLSWVIESTDSDFSPGNALNGSKADCLAPWTILKNGPWTTIECWRTIACRGAAVASGFYKQRQLPPPRDPGRYRG